MNKHVFVFFMWDESNKFLIKYSKKDDINELMFQHIV